MLNYFQVAQIHLTMNCLLSLRSTNLRLFLAEYFLSKCFVFCSIVFEINNIIEDIVKTRHLGPAVPVELWE